MSLIISMGRNYGGFYVAWGYTKHICLGWLAFTFIPSDEKWLDRTLDLAEADVEEAFNRRIAAEQSDPAVTPDRREE